MDANSQLEHAVSQMKQLVDGELVNKLCGENEATIRLLIIDEVLSILGWQRHEYKPEKVTSTGNYTDYRLSIENQARLIVEAKRIGFIGSFPKSIRFNDFYGLISREAIRNNSLEEKFASMMLIRPNITIHPQEEIGQSTNIGQAPHRQVIRAIFDQFMGDITRPGQEKMLEYCYVEDYTTNEFSRELQQILQYDARLDELDMTIEEADNDSLEKELDFQSHSRHPKTILLVGNVGAGKSTFIHRFSRKAQPNCNICTIVDLINHSTKEIERNQAEEQHLAELVIDKLALEFRDKADPYSPEILRGCFEVEINRFRKQRQNLLQKIGRCL
ncbi:MAG TPA: hypothetical protein VFB60_23905 [Ktedonobacteraceae bacterium]|nr:hypothetical protein [Ktedonobacteraceae bacterium]